MGKKGMGLSSMNPPGTVIIMETHSYDISKFTRAGVIKFLDTFPPSKHISLKFQPRSGRNSSSIKSILELVILRHFKLPCLPHVNHRLFLFSSISSEKINSCPSVCLLVGWELTELTLKNTSRTRFVCVRFWLYTCVFDLTQLAIVSLPQNRISQLIEKNNYWYYLMKT